MNVTSKRFFPGSIDYDSSISADYSEGRTLSLEAAAAWRTAVEPFIPRTPRPTILDLGAGTGRFAPVLADLSAARVIGIEPSLKMLGVAVRQHLAAYVAGSAETIPLRDDSCDVAWLSHVFHHVRERAACASELRRVVRSGGRVLVRGTFADRLDGYPTLFRFFPGARRICADLPTISGTASVFEGEKFTLEADLRIQQRTCGSLREFAARASKRADTSLALLSDDEFDSGLTALQEAAAQESGISPIVETVDLLVFQRHHSRAA
jgi:SAM-dependent methyltransferase